MDEQASMLTSYLHEKGLVNTEYWLLHFKNAELTSVSDIELHANDMNVYSALITFCTSSDEKEALRKVFKITIPDSSRKIQQPEVPKDSKFKSSFNINKIIQQSSSGLILQGVYLTKNLDDQLEMRSPLISIPENIKWNLKTSSSNSVKICFSKLEASYYKRAMEILGCSITLAPNMPVYGEICIPSFSVRKNKPALRKMDSYASTTRYYTVQTASCFFEMNGIKLSDSAKVSLRSILSIFRGHKDVSTQVLQSCDNFFQTYGSHVNLGPVHFGGHILWECCSSSFTDHKYDSILKTQNDIISSVDNKFKAGTVSDSVILKMSVIGGSSNATSLSEWKSELQENSESWIVVDRGRNLAAIWDIIKFNYEEEFGEIQCALKTSWEYKVRVSEVTKYQLEHNSSSHVLNLVGLWSPADCMKDSEIQQKLEYLLNVKFNVNKIPGQWAMQYMSQSPIQTFLLSIVNLKRKALNHNQICDIMCNLLELNEAKKLIKQGFHAIKIISDWLYVTNSQNLKKKCEDYDFSKFNAFLINILEEKASDSELSKEALAVMVGGAIQSLRSHYKHTYEDILIAVLIYPYQSTYRNMSTVNPLTLSDIKNLLESFLEQKSLFYESWSKSSLYLQLNLLILASKTVKKADFTSFFEYIGGKMQKLQPPLKEPLLQCLKTYFENSSIETLKTSLHALAEQQHSRISKPLMLHSSNVSVPSHLEISENAQENCNDLPAASNNKGRALLERLELLSCYENKLKVIDALCIRPEIIQISIEDGCCSDLKKLPYLVLQKLMSYDCLCRYDLIQKLNTKCSTQAVINDGDSDDYSNSDDDDIVKKNTFVGINPTDCLLALLLCCDDFLRHDLFCRLSKCQFAVPLIMPDPISKELVLPLWALKSIIKDWISKNEQEQQKSHPMVTYSMPIISFMRFGNHRKNGPSKSQIINKLISDEENCHFFHRDCHGGQYKKILGEGLVDMSWYLPSGKPTDPYPNPITFLNLHGNAHEHYHQARFLSEISSVAFIILFDSNFEFTAQDKDILRKMDSQQNGLVVLNGTDKKPKELKKEFPNSHFINLTRTKTEVNKAIQKRIKSKLEKIDVFFTIECLCRKHNHNFIIDEDYEGYRSVCQKANEIVEPINSFKMEDKTFKEFSVPLQGKDLWQSWAALDKELNRQTMRGNQSIEDYSAKIEEDKQIIRQKQLMQVNCLSSVIQYFIKALIELEGADRYRLRNFFLQNLKLELNSLSRENICKKQQDYLATRKELSEIPPEQSESNDKKKKLKKKLEDLQEDIIESSFGLEHLLREVGQIYEASSTDERYKDFCALLCKSAAELLIDGYPLEVMDGDATHVPLKWVQGVLSEVIKKVGDHKIFVLSVLGLQSTGKSTMLNTTFGLQFNVSAGRCTRGAFMQIVPLDDTLQASTGCSYVLIVDTEGLRAPELDPLRTQKHDNQLATFVIGIANMTLINIYGEVPGDMDDILQTSVHAFLRMTQVKFHPSCQFVHQNAGVNIKGEVGRAKFTQKLNKFTVDAAREEQCEGQYESFSQVIAFDDQTDVHYFPGLWRGDPPMAPVNQGYSHSAQKLKSHVIQIICNRACSTDDSKYILGGLKLSSFSLKVTSLWQNLLKEKFVFSFKNTLEIVAYNSLETEYSKWDWELQMKMLEWERKAYNEIKDTDLKHVENVVEKKLKELLNYVSDNHSKMKSELETFFNGKYSEVLVQWKASYELRLEKLASELVVHAEQQCEILLQKRKAISEFEKKQKKTLEKIKVTVQEDILSLKQEQIQLQVNLEQKKLDSQQITKLLSRDLFTVDKINRYKLIGIEDNIIEKIFSIKQENGGKLNEDGLKHVLFKLLTLEQVEKILKHFFTLSEKELKKKFDDLWNKEIFKITRHYSKRKINVPKIVQTTLIKYTRAKGGRDTHLISQLRDDEWKDWAKGELRPLKAAVGYHYIIICNIYEYGKHYIRRLLSRNDRFEIQVEIITASVIQEAKEHVEQIPKSGTNFKATFVQELLRFVDERIEHHASQLTEFSISFTPNYRHEVYLRVCNWAIPKFEEMAKLFDDQNDPKLYLEKYHKEPLFIKYRNQYKQIEFEEAIADTICAYLEEPLKVQVRETLGERIIDKMKAMNIYYVQNKMALKVKILLDLQKKGDFHSYVVYISKVRECLVQHLTRYTVEFCETKVKDSPFTHLQVTAREQVSYLFGVVNNSILKINKEDISLQEWIHIFCENSDLTELGLKLKAEDLLEGYEYSQELNHENLRKNITQQLHLLEEKVLKSFENICCETEMPNWTKQPHELLKNLIGCTAQCPFCGEQCDLLEHDVKDQLHRTEVHRIDCLAGWRDKISQVMVTGFCPSLVADCSRQFYTADDKLHFYHKYREVYPTWSIPPNLTTDTKYWKWFVNKYRIELAQEYVAKPAVIPLPWTKFEWKDVKQDLENVYNIQAADIEE